MTQFIEWLREEQVEDELSLFDMNNYTRYGPRLKEKNETISKDSSRFNQRVGTAINDNGSGHASLHPRRV